MAPNGFGAQVVTFDRESCVLYKQALDEHLPPEASDIVMSVNSGEDEYAAYRRDRDAEEKLLDRFRDPTDPLKILIVTSKLLTGLSGGEQDQRQSHPGRAQAVVGVADREVLPPGHQRGGHAHHQRQQHQEPQRCRHHVVEEPHRAGAPRLAGDGRCRARGRDVVLGGVHRSTIRSSAHKSAVGCRHGPGVCRRSRPSTARASGRRAARARASPAPVWQDSPSAFIDGGTSIDGFWSKKPNGLSQNDTVSAGMIGQSSTRVMWWMPKTYQSTTSVFSSGSSSAIHSVMPASTVGLRRVGAGRPALVVVVAGDPDACGR